MPRNPGTVDEHALRRRADAQYRAKRLAAATKWNGERMLDFLSTYRADEQMLSLPATAAVVILFSDSMTREALCHPETSALYADVYTNMCRRVVEKQNARMLEHLLGLGGEFRESRRGHFST